MGSLRLRGCIAQPVAQIIYENLRLVKGLMIYHPTNAEDFCSCGSGKRFGACCQWLPYWRPVCPNPGQGCSLMYPQSARFTNIPYKAVHAFLQDDDRLHCIEDTPQRAFWIYWGNPAFAIPQGRLCFGDIE